MKIYDKKDVIKKHNQNILKILFLASVIIGGYMAFSRSFGATTLDSYSSIILLNNFEDLYPYLKTNKPELASLAVWRMATIYDSRIKELFQRMWKEEKLDQITDNADTLKDPKVKLMLAASLLKFGDGENKEYINYIHKKINDRDDNVRSYAVTALGSIDDQETVIILAELIREDNNSIVVNAVSALKQIILQSTKVHEFALKKFNALLVDQNIKNLFVKEQLNQAHHEIAQLINKSIIKNAKDDLSYKSEFEEGENHQKALTLIKPYAVYGDAKAQYYLGEIYSVGRGVTHDYNEGVKWLTLSAEQGLASAEFSLANLYIAGQGVERDFAKAINLLRSAANKEDKNSQELLAEGYRKGWWGLPQDFNQANYWLQRAKKDK